ncbi:MAG: hypothetical protein JNK14_03505 [Chitinophagaceae bacterium]|nr:hypothetical protein [Chitinophagaceae bacterium]
MNHPSYHNDQAHIAEEFHFIDEHTSQTARLAYFKINSYKLSLIKASFSTSKDDMTDIIRRTLLNYTDAGRVLANLGFFDSEMEN